MSALSSDLSLMPGLPPAPSGQPAPGMPPMPGLPPMSGLPPMPPAVPSSPVESKWLTDKGRDIRDKARALIPLIREQAREGEKIGALTPDVLKALSDIGIYKMAMPAEWGGYALGARDLVEIIATLGEADGSAGWAGFVAVGVKNLLALEGEVVGEVLEDTRGWAGPTVVGASVFATKVGEGRKVEGGWMVKGRWAFGSGCKHAKWAMLGIEYDPKVAGGTGRGVVVVDRSKYEILDDWHVMGLSGSASNSLAIKEEVFVPDRRFLDLSQYPLRFQQLHTRYQGFGYQQRGLANLVTVSLCDMSIALGMARGALSCFAEQAKKRPPFSLPYPTISDMASAQVAAGKALAMIKVAQATIESYADQVDARTAEGQDFTHDEDSEISLTLAYVASLCEDAINLLQKTLGSSTMSLSNPIQRFVRDVRVLASHGAVRLDPQAEVNGRRLLGITPFPMFAGAVPERVNLEAKGS
ncbi:oxidoreductase [Agrobacterium vitis]|uniref:Oxidoreductase n=2 Tax=Agrobacterium vitis TaxID=373 RepID=A0AAE4WGE3_AGRVI|nr:oxidoreductase [Allorhizobium sp. Av2]MUZ58547.1 oxidoreductase [Agrobacterium vitis]MVA65760.1 oxidoreductase [Agrobacterium vitis]MVA88219.1 oxidoreductase [Agrobacterium vitis]